MRSFIVGGSPDARPPLRLAPGDSDTVIAADLGAHYVGAWGWPLHLVVGDLDSLRSDEAQALRALGVPILTAPAAKDETDVELALAQALARGAREIVLCGVLGGRVDHLLANVLLLGRPDLSGLDVSIAEGGETLRLLRGGNRLLLAGTPGDLLSLLPLGADASGVSTRGLRYPLQNETLYLGRGRGVSNVLEAEQGEVTLADGLLLVIHTQADRA